jgi:hypothetical protein
MTKGFLILQFTLQVIRIIPINLSYPASSITFSLCIFFGTTEALETESNISSGVGKYHLKPVQRMTGTKRLLLLG